MKIELVAYNCNLTRQDRIEFTAELFNSYSADIIMFSGHTLERYSDVQALQRRISNRQSFGILEVRDNLISKKLCLELPNSLFTIQGGKVADMFSSQLFTDSSEINGKPELAHRLLNELLTRRSFKFRSKRFTVLQCGEINILANKQNEANKPYFRFVEDKHLNSMFEKVVSNTDVFLNPIHTPMGNLGKMQVRKAYLSKNKHYYFSTNNFGEWEKNCRETKINSTNIHYAYYDGNDSRLEPIEEYLDKKGRFVYRVYEIK